MYSFLYKAKINKKNWNGSPGSNSEEKAATVTAGFGFVSIFMIHILH